MATLEQQRRASGASMEAGRRASGAAMEAGRRAIDDQMVYRRTGETVADVQAIVIPPQARRALPAVPARGALPVTRGVGTYTPPTTQGTGSGIASPLKEKTTTADGKTVAAGREYHPAVILVSSDGLFTFEVEHIKKLVMQDANEAEVIFEYALPE